MFRKSKRKLKRVVKREIKYYVTRKIVHTFGASAVIAAIVYALKIF